MAEECPTMVNERLIEVRSLTSRAGVGSAVPAPLRSRFIPWTVRRWTGRPPSSRRKGHFSA